MAKITHDIVATIGKYTDRQGVEKKRYINIGKAFTDDQGRVSLKLDAIPLGPEWSGWASLYPVERGEQQQPRTASRQDAMPDGRQQQRTMPPAPAAETEEDDIPF